MAPQPKLGKKEAKKDNRNFRMAALLKTATAPDSYNFDASNQGNVDVQALDAMLEKVNPVAGCIAK